jgi:hypothetical protein
MNGVQGELLTTGTTAETPVTLTDVDKNERKTFYPKVISGTVKFGVNDVPTVAQGFTSTDVVPPISCFNGELYVLQASGADTFVLTATAG